jgi:hypothetical protein
MLLASLATSDLPACSCYGINYFCEAVTLAQQYGTDQTLVVRGRKVKAIKINEYQEDMIFEVVESFINPKGLRQVLIIGGNGADCGRDVSEYSKNDELIIHAYLWEDPDTGEIMGRLSICEPAPLKVKRGNVHGAIAEGISTISLSGFRELSNCSLSRFDVNIAYDMSSHKISLDLMGPAGEAFLSVFDFSGRELFRQKLQVVAQERKLIDLPANSLPTGLYVLQLRSSVGNTTRRIIVP